MAAEASRRFRILQTLVLAMLLVFMVALQAAWVLADSDRFSWTLTPAAFIVGTLSLSAVASFTLSRRPRNRLVGVTLILMLVGALSAASLDLPHVSTAPVWCLTAGAGSLLGASIAGNRRAMRGVPVSLVLVGAVVLALLTGGSLFGECASRYDAFETFIDAKSPDGRWLLIGVRSNMGATDSGTIEVVVRRDVLSVLRRQRTVFSAEGLADPRIAWADSSTLSVNRRIIHITD